MTISLDRTVPVPLRTLLALRAAAVTSTSVGGEALTAAELRQFGLAPQREKHVVVNLADLRHAQQYGVLDSFLDTLDRQADVVDVVASTLDPLIRTTASGEAVTDVSETSNAEPVRVSAPVVPAATAAADTPVDVVSVPVAAEYDDDDEVAFV